MLLSVPVNAPLNPVPPVIFADALNELAVTEPPAITFPELFIVIATVAPCVLKVIVLEGEEELPYSLIAVYIPAVLPALNVVLEASAPEPNKVLYG